MRSRVPGWLTALLLGVLAALAMLGLCLAGGLILAQQVLVAGSQAEWAGPALATMLAVLGSLGPVGFYNETDAGAIGFGIEAAALPWALVAAAPAAVVSRWVRSATSRVAELLFALGYGLAAGLGVGLMATWAVDVEPGLDLPVSPDLVAARSALIALAVVVLVQMRERLGSMAIYLQSVIVGGMALVASMTALWLVGLIVAILQAPSEIRQGLTTAGSVVGANLSAASLFASLGVDTEVSIGSGLTGTTRFYTLAEVTGLSDWAIALIGSAIVVGAMLLALMVALRGAADLPPVLPVLGVIVGFAAAGAAAAALISGTLDLVILPLEASERSFSEVELTVDPSSAFTQLGARALFVCLPILGLRARRAAKQEVSSPVAVESSAEQLKVANEV